MKENYSDIIRLPAPTSQKHSRMPLTNRAAQFAPFAALTGYESAISETKRLTKKRIDLDEDEMQELEYKLKILLDHIDECPFVWVTHFQPDSYKEGGEYLTITGQIKKYNEIKRQLIFLTGEKIWVQSIVDIDSPFFDSFLNNM